MNSPLILVLCTGNSCRSQMAEYLLADALKGVAEVQSAGSNPAGFVHPQAIAAMQELGHDLSAARSKHLDEFLNREVFAVITVCGNADEACPAFPGHCQRHHFPFDDPAHATGTEKEIQTEFVRVRDEIQAVFQAYAAGVRDGLEINKQAHD